MVNGVVRETKVSSKLKLCPFCGSAARAERTDLMSRVSCSNPDCNANIWSGEFQGIDAVTPWNKRVCDGE